VSELGIFLQNLPEIKIVEVYADPHIKKSVFYQNKIVLPTAEKYENLSIKSFMMIDFCVTNFKFTYLVKVDVTVVMTEFNSPSYAGCQKINLQDIKQFLNDPKKYKDYNGFELVKAGKRGAENWAAKKGGSINYDKIFGDADMPEYFSGKLYILSRDFAQFISNYGAVIAQEQVEYFMGSEDVMIGRLYKNFSR